MSDFTSPVGPETLAALTDPPVNNSIVRPNNSILRPDEPTSPSNELPTPSQESSDRLPPPMTDEQQSQLEEYRNAIKSEYERADSKTATARKNIDAIFVENGETAAMHIIALATHANSEMVRFTAGKYVVEYVRELSSGTEGDPFKNLIETLQANTNNDSQQETKTPAQDEPADILEAFSNSNYPAS